MYGRRIGYCSKYHLPRISRPRVFISYSNDDMSQVALLRNLRSMGKLNFVDYSIKHHYDFRWEASARYRIRESDCVIIALNSDAIGDGMWTEINMAYSMGKPIFVICNSEDIFVPDKLRYMATRIIPFRCSMIQKAIDWSHRYRTTG